MMTMSTGVKTIILNYAKDNIVITL